MALNAVFEQQPAKEPNTRGCPALPYEYVDPTALTRAWGRLVDSSNVQTTLHRGELRAPFVGLLRQGVQLPLRWLGGRASAPGSERCHDEYLANRGAWVMAEKTACNHLVHCYELKYLYYLIELQIWYFRCEQRARNSAYVWFQDERSDR
jgi:hypothetical protein